ncbi:serine hydrolase domain-containing protein [Streptomyces sp. NPDC059874]|uniref:serine hydrolase domain-containing protein n=1 Tax=Streptomyces sp. NPDC059874 TaxID=3346983 RepID=UPI003649D9D0
MAEIHGTYSERFGAVRDVLAASLDSGNDLGASVAVFVDGKPVVDIWGGYADAHRTRPWERDTITNVYSFTKTMTGLCALVLIDRGLLDLDAPVARYWPAFAQNGKDGVTVRHVLQHTSGLPAWTEEITPQDMCDLEKSTDLLARQAPWWAPGTVLAYHCFTTGHMVNALTQRVTGLTLGRFLAREVCAPLGPDADFHIGTGPECDDRVSLLTPGTPVPALNESAPTERVSPVGIRITRYPYVTPDITHNTWWRRAEVGGANGHGNARAGALIQSVMACGGEVNGVRLLSEDGCRRVLDKPFTGMDVAMSLPFTWGNGYCLNNDLSTGMFGPAVRGHRLAYWGGNGGSFVLADLDTRMSVAYVPNLWKSGVDDRAFAVIQAAYAST